MKFIYSTHLAGFSRVFSRISLKIWQKITKCNSSGRNTIMGSGIRISFIYIIGWIWMTRIILAILWVIQLTGNGLVIWLLLFKTKLRKSNYFILALAISDFLSALGAPIGAYREDLGIQEYNIPYCFQYIYVILEMLTTFITWNLISSFALIRICHKITRVWNIKETFATLLDRYLVICRQIYFHKRTILAILAISYLLPVIGTIAAPFLADWSTVFTSPINSEVYFVNLRLQHKMVAGIGLV